MRVWACVLMVALLQNNINKTIDVRIVRLKDLWGLKLYLYRTKSYQYSHKIISHAAFKPSSSKNPIW
jgi:hypothetical protein